MGPRLRDGDLQKIDGIKARFWKKCLGLGKNTSNTLTMKIARETYATDDLCGMGIKIKGEEVREYLRRREEREGTFRREGYEEGPAFRGTESHGWRGDLEQTRRSAVCRVTAHGLHHQLCTEGKKWHEIGEECSCKKCGQKIGDRWHILECLAIPGEGVTEKVSWVEGTCKGAQPPR